MKKKRFGRKLGRGQAARTALFRSLVRSLTEHGSIRTTQTKAKAFQGEVDKLVNIAKSGNLSDRRRVLAILGNDKATTKRIFEEIAPVFKKRKGGYTRTTKLPTRKGDRASMVRWEWVESVSVKDSKAGKKRKDGDSSKKGSKLSSVAKKVTGGKKKSKNKSKKNKKK